MFIFLVLWTYNQVNQGVCVCVCVHKLTLKITLLGVEALGLNGKSFLI